VVRTAGLVRKAVLTVVQAAGVASLVAVVLLVPALIKRIPADYFSHSQRHRLAPTSRYPAISFALAGAKNLLGATLVLAGLLMLFVPGQGRRVSASRPHAVQSLPRIPGGLSTPNTLRMVGVTSWISAPSTRPRAGTPPPLMTKIPFQS